jgi:N-acetylneuraminate synthase
LECNSAGTLEPAGEGKNVKTFDHIKIGSREIGPGRPAYVIAEIGSNHDGDIQKARDMIDVAAAAGCDAVKFQIFRGEYLCAPDPVPEATEESSAAFFADIDRHSMPWNWTGEVKAYSESKGLTFLCSAFDDAGVELLASHDVAAHKVASPELNHLPLLRKMAQTGKPLIVSTGLSKLGEIEEALETIDAANPQCRVILMHCVSAYPTPREEANLAVIETMRRCFGLPVGFSDHTMGALEVPVAAVKAGACAIEKHYTMSRSLAGPDHPFAIEPEELASMVRAIRLLESRGAEVGKGIAWQALLGDGRKQLMPSEAPAYPHDKRSIHAIRDIRAGEPLSVENIRILRSPGPMPAGLHARYWELALGSMAYSEVRKGQTLQWEHLLPRNTQ